MGRPDFEGCEAPPPSPAPFAHLRARSWFSFLRGGSSPEALAGAAAAAGVRAMALTDVDGLYGAVRWQAACEAVGVRPLFGAEVMVDGGRLVLLAGSRRGFAGVNRVLTAAHGAEDRHAPETTWDVVAAEAADVWCLTGTDEGRLWSLVDAGRTAEAGAWVGRLREAFGERLSVELAHPRTPGARRRVGRLLRVAERAGVPVVASGDVRHATADDYRRLDLLTCVRLGTTVFDPHAERPRNAERSVLSERELRRRLPIPEAFARAADVAAACHVDLLPGHVTPPAARLPPGVSARAHLRLLCGSGAEDRYGAPVPEAVRRQIAHELGVIADLELDDFFLVVHEIVEEARRRGIRCAGRGSAANSIVAYVLGITHVDPIKHGLLFERFLHGGRRGTPDIDVDFDTARRGEMIAWMEERFGTAHTAMSATVVEYRLRSALRDTAKAFGYPMEVVDALSKAVQPGPARAAREVRPAAVGVLGESPLVDPLLEAAASLEGCPRHLGQHSGGMVLARAPLETFTPVQRSANGVMLVQFDKDDLEALGLIKFDVLGLRMLSVLTEARTLVARHEGVELDLERLPLDDVRAFNLIRASDTVGCFQIESHGQLHLLAQHQPETFHDLVVEVALFRPGPLQSNMVHPYVRRRRGQEPVTVEHPSLAPILRDTQGIILFQEQILEVAVAFAGMGLREADEFRRLMSKNRDPEAMEAMREPFVAGAAAHVGASPEVSNRVFDTVSKYVGYGFCRSHAAAFAQTVYLSCYLKARHPAAYMAAVMEHRPGMYALTTLQQDAARRGVRTLPPDLVRSGVRYDLERDGEGRLAIRMPFSALRGWTSDDAAALVWERLRRPFADLQDLWERSPVGLVKLRTLARSGGLDGLACDARGALWELGVLEQRRPAPGTRPAPDLFGVEAVASDDVPDLPPLAEAERLSWDYAAHGAARAHPMGLRRPTLDALEIRSVEVVRRLARAAGGRAVATTAGVVISRQRPRSANGVLFLVVEDETGFIQCIIRPEVLERVDWVVRSGAVIARGPVTAEGNWAGLVVTGLWPLDGVFGGYEGHPSMAGGLDRHVTSPAGGRRRALSTRDGG